MLEPPQPFFSVIQLDLDDADLQVDALGLEDLLEALRSTPMPSQGAITTMPPWAFDRVAITPSCRSPIA